MKLGPGSYHALFLIIVVQVQKYEMATLPSLPLRMFTFRVEIVEKARCLHDNKAVHPSTHLLSPFFNC